ncbi:MAG: hypothetical protein CMH31_02500 [Micavibrio sp.]|nr:hypothetical protein [Micavibrio sp.]|tara:strand:+ start:64 stop:288 length:225 start_codon:yes stop_codon:yes gene_type:complete
MNYEDIKIALDKAADENNKTALFHYIFLKHAPDFIEEKPEDICKQIGATQSMAQEIRKMRALYLFMKEKNLDLN